MVTDAITNTVYFSSLLPERCPLLNGCIVEALQKYGVKYGYLSGTKDIWCRDFMPIQIEKNHFVSYKYTPDYLQYKKYIELQTNLDDVYDVENNYLQNVRSNSIPIDLVIDGGNVVKCGDTIVMTEKVLREKANQDKSPDEIKKILSDVFQCEIIYLPWDKKEPFGHSDGIIHYIGNGKVLMTNYDDYSIDYYNQFRDKLCKKFDVITLKYKVKEHHEDSWAYINFLQVGHLVFVPQLGYIEDEQALEQISNAMPDCKVIGIPALKSVKDGGALNCISWNIAL